MTQAKSSAQRKTASSTSGIEAASVDDLLSGKAPIVRKVPIFLDDDSIEALEAAQEEFKMAEALQKGNPERYAERFAAADEALKAAQAEAKKHARFITFRSIGRKRYDAIIHEHPATPEQQAQVKEMLGHEAGFNSDTFPQALVQASMVVPTMTIEQVNTVFEEWNSQEINALFEAAMDVNTKRRVAELGK